MILFEGVPGRVVAYRDPAQQIAFRPYVSVFPALGFTTQKSIITRVSVAAQSNFQFLHTLGGDIFVYVFGDRIGQVLISGLSFSGDCPAPQASESGLDLLFQWYNANRISSEPAPISVYVGLSTVINGWVTGITTDIIDPQSWISQYNLQLMVLPPRR